MVRDQRAHDYGVAVAGGIGWAAYDIWDTPRILRRRLPVKATLTRTAMAPLVGSDRFGLALTIVR